MTYETIVGSQSDRRYNLRGCVIDGKRCVTVFRGNIPTATITFDRVGLRSFDWRPYVVVAAGIGRGGIVLVDPDRLTVRRGQAEFTIRLRWRGTGFEVDVSEIVLVRAVAGGKTA